MESYLSPRNIKIQVGDGCVIETNVHIQPLRIACLKQWSVVNIQEIPEDLHASTYLKFIVKIIEVNDVEL